jgi:hypothetical protein
MIKFRQQNDEHLTEEEKHKISHNEAMLRAMIEDSQSKSWRENIDDAVQAQDHFMTGESRSRNEPPFMKRIRSRSEELVRRDTLRETKA